MSHKELELLYENVVLETTADCSTTRRIGLKDDGGWDVCLVGPFVPRPPCFSFSFGINNVWEFDDELAATFNCQVFAFDPSMSAKSHMRSDRVAFLREGLHAAKGTLYSWPVDSYLGYLKRFKAESFVIDVLKIDVESSEWPALETALKDGSLSNVKQLLIETHSRGGGTSREDFQRFLLVLRALYEVGFRQWHHNWNLYGNYRSSLHSNMPHTCCHELYYVNANFLNGSRLARNPSGTQIKNPLGALTCALPRCNSTPLWRTLEAKWHVAVHLAIVYMSKKA